MGIDELKSWVGRSQQTTDVLSQGLVARFCATFDRNEVDLPLGTPAPLAVHWALGALLTPTSELGPDGHPKKGGFLPPVPLPRRMWAAGDLNFHDRLRVGDEVRIRSEVASIDFKEGRSGALCFVRVDHQVDTSRGRAITEQQTIVYREASTSNFVPSPTQWDPPEDVILHREMKADTVLLFRYSALTFNSHRIHYDRDYAVDVERYPGLVVQAPLQATLLMNAVDDWLDGRKLKSFSFRAERPMYDGDNLHQFGRLLSAHEVALWTCGAEGVPAVSAKVEF
ncbi:FAS1-like dehydratase domain-containing protein [Martelella soudanensis]|uniref:FAS1-like dehydratase domain-containing protein n=1 Tax=unclassified Martelella TaxID=2629616 RepID=UPI0015DE1697|nr:MULTISPECIES: MaoC family dehydratase N-terminal domain-containing protein [unclassified Martelella]